MSASITGVPREPRLQAIKYWILDRKLPVFGWSLILILIMGALGLWKAGAVDPTLIAEPPTSFGTEGANLVERGGFGSGVEVGAVGDGLSRTYIIRKTGSVGPQPAVLFLHGFGSSIVAGYEPWLEHIAKEGVTVIFPSWQQPPFPIDGSQNPRTNMFEGVRLAIEAVPVIRSQVVAAGLSAGAALAFDYAALGSKEGVPPAKVVYSVYPGRAFPGVEKPILPIPPIANMPADTKVISIVSKKDEEVGTRWGRQQERLMKRERASRFSNLVYVTTRGLTSHYDPAKTTAPARRVFWDPLDALLTKYVGARLQPDTDLEASIAASRAVKEKLKNNSLFRKKAEAGSGSVTTSDAAVVSAAADESSLPGH